MSIARRTGSVSQPESPIITQPRRILIVSHQFPPQLTGIGNVAAAEAANLVASGNEVTVLSTGDHLGSDTMTADGYRLVRAAVWEGLERRTRIPFPIPGPGTLATARRLARWADLVHIHDVLYMPCWAAAWAARAARRPVVVTQHVAVVAHTSKIAVLAQRLVYRSVGAGMLRRAERVIVLNARVQEFVLSAGVAPSRVSLLPNGVDAVRFRPATPGERDRLRKAHGLPPAAVLALFVGRFVPKKGLHRLLAALGEDYVVVLVGGERPPGVPEDGRTIFLGPLAPGCVAEVYRAVDIFVMPSDSEGFPLTVQEAMASGLPVVLRHDDGYAPYGLEAVGVRFVDGTAASIRRELSALAADPELRRALGAAAAAHARAHFAWRDHTARLEAVWDDLFAGDR
jgi:glycosyltransferase involved in cell wall biosynthesis